MTHSRRHFFLVAVGSILRAEDRPKRDMLVRSTRPEDLEMPVSGFADYITPIEHFFVRTHVYVPTVDPSAWRLKVEGEVAAPLTLTMDDLRKLPSVELVAVLECAGNGRGWYEPAAPGLQWRNGAVGNGRWRGVRLADILRKVGIKDSAKEVLFDGADVPLGKMPDFQRSIPVKKALDPNTLLAYEMNGETLPMKHGFPLRVVVPGWASDSWMKWLTSIRLLDKESDGFWMKSAYRRPDGPVAPGTSVPADQMTPVTSLRVKSAIATPADRETLSTGALVTVRGVAWSGDAGPVTSVEVSTDTGRTWKPAKLFRDQRTPFGWRQWEFTWTPPRAGYYTVISRARDASGDAQPLAQEWNPSGYGWNVAARIGISVSPAPPVPTAELPETVLIGEPAAYGRCRGCHGDDVIRQQRLTRGQWDREIDKMTGWGAQVGSEERPALLDFLEKHLRP